MPYADLAALRAARNTKLAESDKWMLPDNPRKGMESINITALEAYRLELREAPEKAKDGEGNFDTSYDLPEAPSEGQGTLQTYSNSQAYVAGEWASDGTDDYICKQDGTGKALSNTDYWTKYEPPSS